MNRIAKTLALSCLALAFTACGDDGGGGSLEDFFPEVPAPTGDAQAVYAGEITAANTDELIPGPATR